MSDFKEVEEFWGTVRDTFTDEVVMKFNSLDQQVRGQYHLCDVCVMLCYFLSGDRVKKFAHYGSKRWVCFQCMYYCKTHNTRFHPGNRLHDNCKDGIYDSNDRLVTRI
jgi:hypothetical protein